MAFARHLAATRCHDTNRSGHETVSHALSLSSVRKRFTLQIKIWKHLYPFLVFDSFSNGHFMKMRAVINTQLCPADFKEGKTDPTSDLFK